MGMARYSPNSPITIFFLVVVAARIKEPTTCLMGQSSRFSSSVLGPKLTVENSRRSHTVILKRSIAESVNACGDTRIVPSVWSLSNAQPVYHVRFPRSFVSNSSINLANKKTHASYHPPNTTSSTCTHKISLTLFSTLIVNSQVSALLCAVPTLSTSVHRCPDRQRPYTVLLRLTITPGHISTPLG